MSAIIPDLTSQFFRSVLHFGNRDTFDSNPEILRCVSVEHLGAIMTCPEPMSYLQNIPIQAKQVEQLVTVEHLHVHSVNHHHTVRNT